MPLLAVFLNSHRSAGHATPRPPSVRTGATIDAWIDAAGVSALRADSPPDGSFVRVPPPVGPAQFAPLEPPRLNGAVNGPDLGPSTPGECRSEWYTVANREVRVALAERQLP